MRQSSGSPTIKESRPGVRYQPTSLEVRAIAKRYNICMEAAIVTARFAHAIWLGRRRNWMARDCDAGGQVLIEAPWEREEQARARRERAQIREFAMRANKRLKSGASVLVGVSGITFFMA
jgi:hypothetical protein